MAESIWKEQASTNCLLFLTGYPSAEWLSRLGAHYGIDPEFYHRHLSFLTKSPLPFDKAADDFPPILLSSMQRTCFQMAYMSTGVADDQSPADINQAQEISGEIMQGYLRDLKNGRDWRPMDSIVRSYSAHACGRFSIRQAITIYAGKQKSNPEHWVG